VTFTGVGDLGSQPLDGQALGSSMNYGLGGPVGPTLRSFYQASPATVKSGISVVAGDLIVVGYVNGTSSAFAPTCSDSSGNVYTVGPLALVPGGGSGMAVLYALATVTNPSLTVTVQPNAYSAAGIGGGSLSVAVVYGALGIPDSPMQGMVDATPSTSHTSGTVTLGSNGDLVLVLWGDVGSGQAHTPGSGFTALLQANGSGFDNYATTTSGAISETVTTATACQMSSIILAFPGAGLNSASSAGVVGLQGSAVGAPRVTGTSSGVLGPIGTCLVYVRSSYQSTTTSVSGVAVQAGDLIVLGWASNVTSALASITATDTAGNTYALAYKEEYNADGGAAVLYARALTTATLTITVTPSVSGTTTNLFVLDIVGAVATTEGLNWAIATPSRNFLAIGLAACPPGPVLAVSLFSQYTASNSRTAPPGWTQWQNVNACGFDTQYSLNGSAVAGTVTLTQLCNPAAIFLGFPGTIAGGSAINNPPYGVLAPISVSAGVVTPAGSSGGSLALAGAVQGIVTLANPPVVKASYQNDTGNSLASIPLLLGDFIVVGFVNGSSAFTASCTDSLGNAYTQAGSAMNTVGGFGGQVFTARAASAGTATITVTPSLSASPAIFVLVCTGGTLDGSSVTMNEVTNQSAHTTGSHTNSAYADLVLSFWMQWATTATRTPSGGWVKQQDYYSNGFDTLSTIGSGLTVAEAMTSSFSCTMSNITLALGGPPLVLAASAAPLGIQGGVSALAYPIGTAAGTLPLGGLSQGAQGVAGSFSAEPALPLTGSGLAASGNGGSSAGVLTLAGTAAAVHGVSGSSAASLALAGAMIGKQGEAGSSHGASLPLTGQIVAFRVGQAFSSGPLVLAGAAALNVNPAGSLAPGLLGPVIGNAAGNVINFAGSSSASLPLSGQAFVVPFVAYSPNGVLAVTGQAQAVSGVSGSSQSVTPILLGAIACLHYPVTDLTSNLVVTQQPMSRSVYVGQPVTLSVVAADASQFGVLAPQRRRPWEIKTDAWTMLVPGLAASTASLGLTGDIEGLVAASGGSSGVLIPATGDIEVIFRFTYGGSAGALLTPTGAATGSYLIGSGPSAGSLTAPIGSVAATCFPAGNSAASVPQPVAGASVANVGAIATGGTGVLALGGSTVGQVNSIVQFKQAASNTTGLTVAGLAVNVGDLIVVGYVDAEFTNLAVTDNSPAGSNVYTSANSGMYNAATGFSTTLFWAYANATATLSLTVANRTSSSPAVFVEVASGAGAMDSIVFTDETTASSSHSSATLTPTQAGDMAFSFCGQWATSATTTDTASFTTDSDYYGNGFSHKTLSSISPVADTYTTNIPCVMTNILVAFKATLTIIPGTSAGSLALTGASVGKRGVRGSSTGTLAPISVGAIGLITTTGSSVGVLSGLTGTVLGSQANTGHSGGTLGALAGSAQGSRTIQYSGSYASLSTASVTGSALPGDLIVVGLLYFTLVGPAVTDTFGNVYTQVGPVQSNGSASVALFWAIANSSTTGSFTATATATTGTGPGIALEVAHGPFPAAPVDSFATSSDASTTTSHTSGVATVSEANNLAVSVWGCAGAAPVLSETGTGFSLGTQSDGNGMAYRVGLPAGTAQEAVTGTVVSKEVSILAVFKGLPVTVTGTPTGGSSGTLALAAFGSGTYTAPSGGSALTGVTWLLQLGPGSAQYASSETAAAIAANPTMAGTRFSLGTENICQTTDLSLSTWSSDIANVTGFASALDLVLIRIVTDPSATWNIQSTTAVPDMDAAIAGFVQVAEAAGTSSFLFDPENYSTNYLLNNFSATSYKNPILNSPAISRAAMCAQVQAFGQAYGNSLWSRMPNATLHCFFGPTMVLGYTGPGISGIPSSFTDSQYSGNNEYNMLPYLFLGLLSACPSTGHIVDYMEHSYYGFAGLESLQREMTASQNWVSIFFPSQTALITKSATAWVPVPMIFPNPFFTASYGSIYPGAYYLANATDRQNFFTRNLLYCLQQCPAGYLPAAYVEGIDPWGAYGAVSNMDPSWQTCFANALAVYNGSITLASLFNGTTLNATLASAFSGNSTWVAECH